MISYNRTTTTISGADVVRSNQVLAVTSTFSVDAIAMSFDISSPMPRFKNSRSAFKDYCTYPSLIEYQPHVSKAIATVLVPASRLQCWVSGSTVVIEFDRVDDRKG